MIQLQDGAIQVAIDPDYGNRARSMIVHGHEILWTAGPGRLDGIPLLAPWANRLDGGAYWVNGAKYVLNPALENLRYDANSLPIHGLLAFAAGWKVVRQEPASVTSRLEFWRFPRWMAQFPFAHTIEVTHRLRAGSLEIETAIENLCEEPIPVSIGYHPYFQLTDSPRDEWRVHIAARRQVALSEKLIPTGEDRPLDLPNPCPLAGRALDNVFTALTGEPFAIEGRGQKIEIQFGPKYPVAIVYAPAGKSLVCVEPMAAFTNAFNLDHAGIASGLQHVAPGEKWSEYFRITPAGF